MRRYDPQQIEPKWQKVWEKTGIFNAPDKPKDKAYVIPMFPYPSGDGLHVGHPRPYTAADITSHFRRYHGKDVLHATGWDAFGLPAENAAIKKGVHPAENTAKNVENFRRQLKMLGFSYDWNREVNTSDPAFYKWTQWIFLQLFKAGLAYRADGWQWWCPEDKTVLANEQVVDGRCERCGSEVTKTKMTQWYFRVTDYADELIDNLEDLDWPESIKALQRNWIGRSQGAEIIFTSESGDLPVYTTRADTIFGTTYVVLAPEHELVDKLTTKEHKKQVEAYVEQAKRESDIARAATDKPKTGVFTGSYVVNPANDEKIPVWVADYVLVTYGRGAVMAVPAHDERDHQFAQKYKLQITKVVEPPEGEQLPYTGEGTMVNSGVYDGITSSEAREKIVADLTGKRSAKEKTGYKLRDWLISRQRYWGTPIPIVHCPECGPVAVPDNQLPVTLPELDDFLPSGDGRSPLAKDDSFVKTRCPECGKPAERETDTMDTFADSSWYFLRYPSPRDEEQAWKPEAIKAWCPVDTYVGGADHAVLHLIYARFWAMALNDLGHVHFREPFLSLRHHGMIQAEDGQKMSKSKGNVVSPDEIVEAFGADAFRTFEMFIGPYDQAADWSPNGIEGVYRFMGRVWRFGQSVATLDKEELTPVAQTAADASIARTVRQVTSSTERFRFNTAVSGLMEGLNELYALQAEYPAGSFRKQFETYLVLLSPFAPHIAEELWHELGNEASIFTGQWPAQDKDALVEEIVTVVVQVNGKVRASLDIASEDLNEDTVTERSLADSNVQAHLKGKKPEKIVYVPGRVINLVV